jgi:hypothetical protein
VEEERVVMVGEVDAEAPVAVWLQHSSHGGPQEVVDRPGLVSTTPGIFFPPGPPVETVSLAR